MCEEAPIVGDSAKIDSQSGQSAMLYEHVLSEDLPACPQDEDVAEYVLGSLEAARREAMGVHIDTCVSCRQAISTLALSLSSVGGDLEPGNVSAAESSLGPGSQVGRFVVLNLIGAGQMGQVYLAYDPALERNVALKFVHDGDGDGDQVERRFRREARVMAKLAHPNLVAIHDVGVWQSQLYLAMDFVSGLTLRDWLKAKERSWPDIRRVMLEAARGLSAAHQAGIVHRDFKPENILVGKDGRVLVADFGLAVRNQSDVGRESEELQMATPGSGTPAYMAAEQFSGGAPSERSDQFSYCAVLFECLCGTRPFVGETVAELRTSVLLGQPKSFRPTVAGATRIKSIVMRGLALRPEDRMASMQEIVTLLERDEGQRARIIAWAASLVAIAIIGALVFFRNSSDQTASACSTSDTNFSESWNDTVKDHLRDAFAKHAAGAATYERMESVLNTYASDWTAARKDACEATHVRHEQSARLLDQRVQCLDRRKADFTALLAAYSERVDSADLQFAVEASYALPLVPDCSNAAWLSASTPMPSNQTQRDAIIDLEYKVSRMHTLRLAGRYDEGLALATALAPAVTNTKYVPLTASYAYEHGMLLSIDRQDANALRVAREAIQASAKAKDDRLNAQAWILLARIGGVDMQQDDKPTERLAAARAAVSRAGDQIELLAELEHVEGTVLWRAGNHAEAEKHAASAQALTADSLGRDVPRYAQTIHNRGLILADLGEHKQAEELYQEALQVWTSSLGPRHPQVASVLNSLGTLHGRQGEYERAEHYLRQSLAINEDVFGSQHASLASALTNLGSLAKYREKYSEALVYLNRALRIRESSLGPTHVALATTLANLAAVCLDLEKYSQALTYADRAIGIREESQGLDHPGLVYALQHRGTALRYLGDSRESLRALKRSVRIAKQHYPLEDKIVVGAVAVLSEAQINGSTSVRK